MAKRAIQLTWVDPKEDEGRVRYTAPGYARPRETNPDFTDKTVFAQDAVVKVVKTITTGVLLYLVADTVRQILISQLGGK